MARLHPGAITARSGQAGNYTVTVRNAAGAVTSAPVLLTVRCGYFVAPRRLTFGEAGGIASIRIRAYRDCAWEVRNTNAWVEIPPEDWSGRGDREVFLAVQALAGRSAHTGIVTVGDEVVTIIQSPPETVPPSVSVAYLGRGLVSAIRLCCSKARPATTPGSSRSSSSWAPTPCWLPKAYPRGRSRSTWFLAPTRSGRGRLTSPALFRRPFPAACFSSAPARSNWRCSARAP